MTGLLDLPPEIRNCIWFFVESLVPTHFNNDQDSLLQQVEGENSISQGKILAWYNPNFWIQTRNQEAATTFHFFQPNITRVNKQIRSETLSIFYGANTFVFLGSNYPSNRLHVPWPKVLWMWLRSFKMHVPLMRRVEIQTTSRQQKVHELVAALMDSEFNFVPTALVEAGAVLP